MVVEEPIASHLRTEEADKQVQVRMPAKLESGVQEEEHLTKKVQDVIQQCGMLWSLKLKIVTRCGIVSRKIPQR